VTWECLKKHELEVVESKSVVWPDPTTPMNGDVTMHVKLPADLTCPRCVFQWEWVCGNRWGKCANGTEGIHQIKSLFFVAKNFVVFKR